MALINRRYTRNGARLAIEEFVNDQRASTSIF